MEYSVIIPVYNEESVLTETYARLKTVMDGLGDYELIFIDDGSVDASATIIAGMLAKDKSLRLIRFSRNFGHQCAITAGMDYARGDAVIIIDADLQDPPELLPEMARLWRSGYDVVYGKRVSREGESFFKKATAAFYYRSLKRLTDFDVPIDTGDFRLIDRKVCDTMKSLGEKNRYVRGLVSWVGFKQIALEYERQKRHSGVTKYPFRKMARFAIDGITAFSHKPLRITAFIGFAISLVSFVYIIVIIYQRIFTATTVTGWASTMAVTLFTQGIVLIMLGLMGEYIGRIYEEIKNRPIYIVKETLGYDGEQDLS
jgi:dolichol-phosphate mannosyltransferase